jgi:xanthine dehydrogenase molybdenum-binding subunit
MSQAEFNVVGHTTRRKDGVARVTGQEQYTTDVSLPRMLHGRIVSSPYAHARIVRVDTRAAEAIGAVCLTFDDVPKIRYNERIITVPWALHKDHYVLSDKVRRMGEAVAAVAAETEALAEKAARAVVVEYEPLPVITDPVEALKPGAAALYDTVMLGDNEIPIKNNIACSRDILEGDIEAAFAEADIVVEGEFRTPKIYHAQMEPKAVVCRPEANGGITVWATTQSIHNVRIVLGAIFSIPLSKVDVIRIPVGGTFGSSIQMNSPVPIGVALALKARRPVKLALTREEDMHDHTKYPAIIRLKIAAKNDGTLLGADQELIADIGAHIIQGYSYLGVTAGWLASLYKFKAVRHHGVAVYTNKAPSCAMQGFGNPQVTFAVESLMDELAEKLGMDPLELRLKNYVGLGESFWGQGPMVRSLVQSDGVQQLLREGAARIGWERRRGGAGVQRSRGAEETRGRGDTETTASSPRFRRGLGLGRGFHTSSAGAPQRSDVIDFSGGMVKINQDGSVDVITALMDHGGGTLEAAAKLVAETLCVPLDKVNLAEAHTTATVYDVTTHATRGVYAGGGAVTRVAGKVRQEIIETAARFLEVMPDALTMKLDETLGQCLVYAPAIREKRMTLGQIAARCWTDSWKTIAVVDSYRPTNCPPAYVTIFVEVEVDTWTGQVRTLKAVSGSDCGTVVNPDLAAGQLEGGLSKGYGYALIEDNGWDANGQLMSKGYWVDGKTPGIAETPLLADLSIHFADTYEPSGPLGAKGIGEAAMNPVAAAYANAIYNAIGIRFYELPITPEKILAALANRGAEEPGGGGETLEMAAPNESPEPVRSTQYATRSTSGEQTQTDTAEVLA